MLSTHHQEGCILYFNSYVDKTLILSERHCSVLELNEVVIGLSAKDVSGGAVGGVVQAHVWL